jgi:hypothetical protein
MGESLGSSTKTGNDARPSAKATGTLMANNKKKQPKRTSAASLGENNAELKPLTPGSHFHRLTMR